VTASRPWLLRVISEDEADQERRMITEALTTAGIAAKLSLFMGVVPLAMAIVYVVWPTDQRLALMRPLSLATIFAAISGTALGMLHVFRGIGVSETQTLSRAAAIGISESLVPLVFSFGCLTVAWLCVALGLWRRP
jgi:hypothetical protein